MGWDQLWNIIEIAIADRWAEGGVIGGTLLTVAAVYYVSLRGLRRLSKRHDKPMGPPDLILAGVLAIFLGAGIALIGIVWQSLAPNAAASSLGSDFNPNAPMTKIYDRKFDGQTIYVDGNNYVECTFSNVTFVFAGKKPFAFTNSHFNFPNGADSKIRITSTSPVIQAYLSMSAGLHNALDPSKPFNYKLLPREDFQQQ